MSYWNYLSKGILIFVSDVLILFSLVSVSDAKIAIVPACRSEDLRSVGYGTGIGMGHEYFAVSVTNVGPVRCRVGSEIVLMKGENGKRTRLAAKADNMPSDKPVSVLKPRQRAVARITTTWAAEDYNDPDCPAGKPHPRDRVTAIKLSTGAISVLTYSFDLERCLRRVGPLEDDAWLTKCEVGSNPCQPIPADTHYPRYG